MLKEMDIYELSREQTKLEILAGEWGDEKTKETIATDFAFPSQFTVG